MALRSDIAEFPPPIEKAQVLGHDGTLTSEEVKHLETMGYVVAHYKAFTGQKLIQAYFEGLAKGLIEMEPQTFRAIDTIRKQMAKLEKGEDDLKDTGKVAKVDVVTLLRTKGADHVGSEPVRRRGRPPGQ